MVHVVADEAEGLGEEFVAAVPREVAAGQDGHAFGCVGRGLRAQ